MNIGFFGLGRMGGHIAANLLEAGHTVTVWNRSPAPMQALVAKGALAAATPQDAMQGDAIFSMLSNDAVMREVGFAGPLLDRAAKGLIHVYLATISAAISPATPARLSTTICLPSTSVSLPLMMRATTSEPEPAAVGVSKRIGRVG